MRPDSDVIDESVTMQEKIRFFDSDGNELDLPLVSADSETIEVTISLLPVKTVDLTVEFIGAPDGVPKASVDPATVKIAGTQSALDEIKDDTVSVASIDFATLSNEKFKAEIENITLPSGCRIISGSTKAEVSIDLSGYKERTVSVDISEKLDSSKYSADFNIESIDVEIYGPESLIDSISSSDVTAVADFTDLLKDLTGGNAVSLSVPLDVKLGSGYSKCWVYGTYTAEANVKAK